MKTELTEKELALVSTIRDKWIDLAYKDCGKGIDKPVFEKGINWVYTTLLELPEPQVVYCDSIIEALIKITMVQDFDMDFEKDTSLYPIKLAEYKANMLSKEFNEKLKQNLSLKYSYIGWSNFGWVSFYDYFTEIGVLDDEKFNQYKLLIESNVFECFEFEHVVFAVQPPKYIVSNNNLPHNIAGPAIEFYDECKYYYINGVLITKELFESLDNNTYTFEEFLKETNEEIKSAVLFYLEDRDGSEGVFNFIRKNLSEVNSYVNDTSEEYLKGTTKSETIGVYTLFKGNISGNEIAYVRCYCPSTDRMFFLGVEPSQTNAKDAIASLYRVPTLLKDKIVSISRQGEKFSTVFDDETTDSLAKSKFSKSDLSEYTSLTGDEYFEFMKYEF